MNKKHQPTGPTRLPKEWIDWLTRPFSRFMRVEAGAGAMLLLATVAALVLSNSPAAQHVEAFWATPMGLRWGAIELIRPLRGWINDALMTLFFFLVALELKRELVLGELREPRVAALSIAGALGGMLVPAGLYLLLQSGRPGAAGWGTVMATDTAFVSGCLALLGERIPKRLRVFMLSLAIVDDIGAVLVVAIGYSHAIAWLPLALAALGLVVIRALAWAGLRSLPFYFTVGAMVWIAVDASGVHATVAGVILGLMTPARPWVSADRLYAILRQVVAHPAAERGSGATRDRETLQVAEIAARETLSPVERLELGLHPWVAFLIMPLFAFANAGLSLSSEHLGGPIAWAVFVGFAVGKPMGVFAFSWLAVRLGIATRPPDLDWRMLAGGGLLAGIGFTMAMFIANLAFKESELASAKLGIFLASGCSGLAGLVLLWTIQGRRRQRPTRRGVELMIP